ncbi:MAG: VOC family protein [Pseudomonadota bacterium]
MSIHELIVYLRAKDAAKAIDFYQSAFGAVEKFRLTEPSGRIGHAELGLDNAQFFISDEFPEMNILAIPPDTPTGFVIHLHVSNADALIARAVEAGATLIRAPQDHFYGERSGTVRDPFGYEWLIGHSIEDVSPDDMQKRYDALFENS